MKLKELEMEAGNIINPTEDNIIVFSGCTEKWMNKQIIGKELNRLDNFL